MFEYQNIFDTYCKESGLALQLSFEMPGGYETANGTFDVFCKTVFINAERLKSKLDSEKAFYLFHELRHAEQYLRPNRFSDTIKRSTQYILLYDGTCYKLSGKKYLQCKLEGDEEELINLYLGQPHEVDANTFAYEQVRKLYGDFETLETLFAHWMPRQKVPEEQYKRVFSWIDEHAR